jgi:drug/metabolite transporter (DMT)-like permease
MLKEIIIAGALMMTGMMFIPLGDSFAKLLLQAVPYSVELVTWARFAVGAVFVVPLVFLLGKWRGTTRYFLPAALLRGGLLTMGIFLIISAVTTIPLALAFGAFFVGPGVANFLVHFVLSERVRPIEWISVAIGFVGVLLVVQPSATMDTGILYALTAGVCYGAYNAATRWTRSVGSPIAQLAGQLVAGALIVLPFVWEELQYVELDQPLLVLGSGLSSALGNLLAIIAYGMVRAALITPLIYTQLLSATALSVFLFGDQIDATAMFGLAVLFLAGLLPFFRPPQRP